MIIKPRVEIAVEMAKRCSQGLKAEGLSDPIWHPLSMDWSGVSSDEVRDGAKRLGSNSAPVQRLIVLMGADEKQKAAATWNGHSGGHKKSYLASSAMSLVTAPPFTSTSAVVGPETGAALR